MTEPDHVLVQISDPHFVADGLLHGRVDPTALLAAALEAVSTSGCRPDALLLTGDLADVAELERRLFDREPACRPLDRVLRLGGLRLVGLDSTRPSAPDGELTPDQLAWLREVLAEPAPEGTVLAVHHPPILSPIPMINRIKLNQPHQLAEAIEGTDVRMVVSGHAHHVSAGVLGGVPVWIAPATVYRSDVLVPADRFRGVTGGGFTRIDVTDGIPVATFVPIAEPADLLYEIDVPTVLASFETARAGATA